jgi:hypothetical protein
MDCQVLRCTCNNEYQDKKYGNKMRVHNPFKAKSGQSIMYRCTICNHEREGK